MRQINTNKGVDNDVKIALCILVNDPTPPPIPAPSSELISRLSARIEAEQSGQVIIITAIDKAPRRTGHVS